MFIMIASILVNWFFGLLIEELRGKKLCTFALILDVTFNLAILFVFKYLTFVGNEINHIFEWNQQIPDLALPIGISFFTFQAMSYVIDVYRGKASAQENLFYVGLYISFRIILCTSTMFVLINYNRELKVNPFSVLMAARLFELAYSHEFYNKEINVLSGVSFVFYLIHENVFVLGIVRPILWGETSQMLPNVPTVCKVLLFSAAFIVWALALSILYQKVPYRLIDKISNKLYHLGVKIWNTIYSIILKAGKT